MQHVCMLREPVGGEHNLFATKELLLFFCPCKPFQPDCIEPPMHNRNSFRAQNMSHNGFPAKLTCDWDYMSKQRKKVKKKQRAKDFSETARKETFGASTACYCDIFDHAMIKMNEQWSHYTRTHEVHTHTNTHSNIQNEGSETWIVSIPMVLSVSNQY